MFIVLGGPSLRTLDLSLLQRRGIVTMAVNNAAAVVRPTFWVHGDPAVKFHQSIWRDPGIIKFTPRTKLWEPIREKVDGKFRSARQQVKYMPGVLAYNRNTLFNPETFLTEPTVNFGNSERHKNDRFPYTLSTMFSAFKLAYYLGAFRVFLLGCDFNWSYGQDCYAFNEQRPAGVYSSNNNSYRKIAVCLAALKPYFDAARFEVFNCNPDSKLAVFPFADYEDAIASATENVPQELDCLGWYGEGKSEPG